VVFPEPAGPFIQITGYFRQRSRSRNSLFRTKNREGIGRVILAVKTYFLMMLSLWVAKQQFVFNSKILEYQKDDKSQLKNCSTSFETKTHIPVIEKSYPTVNLCLE